MLDCKMTFDAQDLMYWYDFREPYNKSKNSVTFSLEHANKLKDYRDWQTTRKSTNLIMYSLTCPRDHLY
jgi:hypothetical protein